MYSVSPDKIYYYLFWCTVPLQHLQFKADPTINPLCRLCGEENETYWHLATECPRLKSYREETFLDKPPVQDNWDAISLINFGTYQTVYNMMSYNQDYNIQPIYELDYNYSDNSDSDNNLTQIAYRSYL